MGKGDEKTKDRKGKVALKTTRLVSRRHQLSAPLREALHRLSGKLGLFPESDGLEEGGRFRAPVLLPANGQVAPVMGKLFKRELATLRRIGKREDRCHVAKLGDCKVYILPYYYFDGFNALLYLEHEGKFAAAWKEQESDEEQSPSEVLAPGTMVQFQQMLQKVLAESSGI
jgi:hypothetical protein